MPKAKPYVQPRQHDLLETKPDANQLIVLSLYQGTQTYPIEKHIGRYQPESKATKVRYPIAETLNSVLIDPRRDFDCKIYDVPTRSSLNKKIEPSRRTWANSHGISDMWRYSWNYLSEEDAIFKKEFEQAKKSEIKKITQLVKGKKNIETEDPDIQLAVKLMTRCGKGTRRNKVTGNCDPETKPLSPVPSPSSPVLIQSSPVKLPRCPNGTRRNKVTKQCDRV
jgi:hypothetical protein